ncbi:hypothetical protein NUW58_g3394 [Xylaria curta]|uniref:Uncharacterized protein n=1 Tax=Xylaria curta TaxID=42375 RepID=A0ACC1PDI6_9PEZI|nr:hypothetical protein NUW58_g3394 [Xylaria curta]
MSDQSPKSSQEPPPNGSAPTFVLHTPAVDFIENRMSYYHPAFDIGGFRYSPTQSQFVPLKDPTATTYAPNPSTMAARPTGPILPQPRSNPSSINDMGFWAEVFPEAMKRLNQEPLSYSGPYSSQWGIRHLSVWPDVQAKLDMARKKYDYFNSQHVGKFRRKLRQVLDDVAGPLQEGINLVPNIDIVSPIVGVIDLLLDAYRQAAEVRETANSGFDDLPQIFASIDFYFKSYPKDQNIFTASVHLVLAVFKAIEEAVRFYTSTQPKRAGLAILTGEGYEQKLLQSLNEISICSNKLRTQADMSFAHRLISDGDEARKSHATLMQDNWASHQALGVILQGQQVGRVQSAHIGNLLNRILGVLSDLEKKQCPYSPLPSRPITPSSRLLADQGYSPWTPGELWSHLRTPDLDDDDLQRILHNVGEIILEDRGRAEQVISTPHFHDWATSPSSTKLLVHGDFDSTAAANRGMSPFSMLCAIMVKALRLSLAEGEIISLVFFCGCHLVDDVYRGGRAMIRSLLAQLLRQFPAGSIEPDSGLVMQEVERGDISQLCRLFVYLVRQLPPRMTVFCLIDGIGEYESEEYLHGMDLVVMTILELVDESATSGRAKIKLLLLSPQPTVEVRKVFDQEPGVLLHMAQIPTLEAGVSFARIQEQLGVSADVVDGRF